MKEKQAKQKLQHDQSSSFFCGRKCYGKELQIRCRLGLRATLSYLIETADGQLWRRHTEYLKGVVAAFRNVIPSRMNDSIPQPSQESESDVQQPSTSSKLHQKRSHDAAS